MSCRKTCTIRLATFPAITALDTSVLQDHDPGVMFRALSRFDETAFQGLQRMTSHTKGVLPCWAHSMV